MVATAINVIGMCVCVSLLCVHALPSMDADMKIKLTSPGRPAAVNRRVQTRSVNYSTAHAGVQTNTIRPSYHFTRCKGEMNDPNGLQFAYVDVNGTPTVEYHMFFQAAITDTKCGSAHNWGHATSPDLVRWTRQPPSGVCGSSGGGVTLPPGFKGPDGARWYSANIASAPGPNDNPPVGLRLFYSTDPHLTTYKLYVPPGKQPRPTTTATRNNASRSTDDQTNKITHGDNYITRTHNNDNNNNDNNNNDNNNNVTHATAMSPDPCVICPELVPDAIDAGYIGDNYVWSDPAFDVISTNRTFYVLAGSNRCADGKAWCGYPAAGTPQAMLFGSSDLIEWKFVSVYTSGPWNYTSKNRVDCPDTFALPDGRQAMFWLDTGGTRWNIGNLNKQTMTFEATYSGLEGRNTGVTQSLSDHRGRRVQIGWVNLDGAQGFTGVQSLPHVVSLNTNNNNNSFVVSPLPELETLHDEQQHRHFNFTLTNTMKISMPMPMTMSMSMTSGSANTTMLKSRMQPEGDAKRQSEQNQQKARRAQRQRQHRQHQKQRQQQQQQQHHHRPPQQQPPQQHQQYQPQQQQQHVLVSSNDTFGRTMHLKASINLTTSSMCVTSVTFGSNTHGCYVNVACGDEIKVYIGVLVSTASNSALHTQHTHGAHNTHGTHDPHDDGDGDDNSRLFQTKSISIPISPQYIPPKSSSSSSSSSSLPPTPSPSSSSSSPSSSSSSSSASSSSSSSSSSTMVTTVVDIDVYVDAHIVEVFAGGARVVHNMIALSTTVEIGSGVVVGIANTTHNNTMHKTTTHNNTTHPRTSHNTTTRTETTRTKSTYNNANQRRDPHNTYTDNDNFKSDIANNVNSAINNNSTYNKDNNTANPTTNNAFAAVAIDMWAMKNAIFPICT